MNYFDILFAKYKFEKDHPPIIKRTTGNPIILTDAADAPLVECKTEIQGSQDLHGYDKPWVGGAGKNKLPLLLSKIKTFNIAGTWTGNTYVLNGITYVFQSYDNETITGVNISSNGSTGRSVIYYYRDDNAPIVQSQTVTFSGIGGFNRCAYQDGTTWHESTQAYFTATITDGITQIWCELLEGWSGSFTSAPQVEIGSSPTTFTPYSNICPITAYTEGKIEVRGKNLAPSSPIARGQYVDEAFQNNNNRICSDYINILPNITYTASVDRSNTENLAFINYAYFDKNKTYLGDRATNGESAFSGDKVHTFSVSDPQVAYIRLTIRAYSSPDLDISNKTLDNAQLMFEEGSTATTYEPYTSTTHTTTYPSSIYRGSEDVVNGEVRADCGVFSISDYVWSGSNGNFYTVQVANLIKHGDGRYDHCICECYATENVPSTIQLSDGAMSVDNNGYVQIKDTRYASSSDFMAAMGSYKIAYELATPTTSSVTTTNLPIKSLSGYNHIESSTGDLDITYLTQNYQNFVDIIENNFENNLRTRKGGIKPIDVFRTLEVNKEPEEEEKKDEKVEDVKK